MIKIKFEGKEQIIEPTIFPDGTSQVWKIGAEKYTDTNVDIVWKWESESEFFHLLQLKELLNSVNCAIKTIVIPYFPYGRQDKEISDETTFAKKTFTRMFFKFCWTSEIEFIDIHSETFNIEDMVVLEDKEHLLPDVEYISQAIVSLCEENGKMQDDADVVLVYPDAGAARRYGDMFFGDYIVMSKVRDQLTGNITSLEITQSVDIKPNTKFLIVDDICDGGYTFILAAKALKKEYLENDVNLYVSHGIFSKGVLVLRDAGIDRIFTTDSLTELRKHSNKPLDGIQIVGDKI